MMWGQPEVPERVQRPASTAAIELTGDIADSQHSYAVMQCRHLRSPIWSDALSGCQEHLLQSKPGRLGANVEAAWQVTRGAGINVMVVDTPVDYRHEDLAANFDLNRSPGLAAIDLETASAHGTAMASHIAARDNRVGMRGVAPRATLTWYNFHDFASDGNSDSQRWSETAMQAAVINHSYSQTGVSKSIPDSYGHGLVYDKLSENGFGGLGALNIISGGKTQHWPEIEYSTLAEYRSHPAVVVACSTSTDGTRSANLNKSLRGPGLWVCSIPSGVYAVNQDRYAVQSGTPSSPSTAIISGVAALVRAANPGLTWRDVKLILAESAQHNHPSSSGWQQTGAKRTNAGERYQYHHSYGFGVIDAGAAVQLALDWVTLPEYLKEQHATSMEATAIPDDGSEVADTINATSGIDFVEYVVAELDLDAPNFRDLQVELVSPSGTVSVLSEPAPKDGELIERYDCDREGNCPISGKFRFGSAVHLGETGSGNWKLRISDEKENGHLNTLKSWRLKLYGHNTSTASDDDGPTPTVTVTGGDAATEGDAASFTFTASPVPTSSLAVNLEVAQNGEYGAWTGERTVTIPPSGTVTLAMPTSDDRTDETDGSVTATVNSGTGYIASQTQNSASVVVTDNDLTLPVVSIAAHSDVIIEGGLARYKVSAKPRAVSTTIMKITLAKQGDFGITTSTRHVAVPTSGSTFVYIPTKNDDTDEPDGSITATIEAGAGYKVSSSAGSATVTVLDDDGEVDLCVSVLSDDGSFKGEWTGLCDAVSGDDRHARYYTFSLQSQAQVKIDLESSADTYLYLHGGADRKSAKELYRNDDGGDGSNSRISESLAAGVYTIEATTFSRLKKTAFTLTVDGLPSQMRPAALPEISIAAGGGISEGSAASFTVTATPKPAAEVDVAVAISQDGDFGVSAGSQTVTIPASGSQSFTVATTNDSADEADGSVTATVNAAAGYTVSSMSGSASVAVSDDDDAGECALQLPDDAVTVDEITAWRDALSSAAAAGVKRFNRVLAALGTDTGQTPMTAVQAAGVADWLGNSRWDRIARTLAALEQAQCDVEPQVSIAAGGAVTEGGDASFTVTATPKPSADLDVTVTVSQSGDFGVTAGSRTVTIPASGSQSFTVATANDAVDEPDGSVTATVSSGTGYTASSSAGSTTVAVSDDDDPPPAEPEISVAAGSGVTEGAAATFTVTASPAPAASLDVSVTVSQSGDFAATGERMVTIPTTGSAEFTVATTNDSTDEADGSVTATIDTGTGYTVSSSAGSATVAVSDDDDPPPPPPPPADCVSDGTLESARDYYELHRDRAPGYGRNWLRVLVAFGDVVDDQLTAFTAAEALEREQRWFGWRPFREALECIEAARQTPPPPVEPEISIAAGNGITEGSTATFTLTASPAPTAALTVEVTVSQSGDFGVTTGARTVAIPTTGTFTLSMATTGDSVDEADGSVTVTVDTGTGYTVSSSHGSATVAVADDDPAPPPPPPAEPEISVAAGSDITEGGDATFTITASPAPASALLVSVTVAQSGSFGVSTGARTVTVPTGGTYTLNVATADDSTDEADGSVTATIGTGTGYTVSSSDGSATVAVADDDDPAPPPPPPPAEPQISIAAGSDVTEGTAATFTLTASPAPPASLEISVTVSQSGDFAATGERTVSIPMTGSATFTVATTDDTTDEADGSVTATVGSGTGYTVSSSAAAATVAVSDDDDPPPPPAGPPTVTVSDATAAEDAQSLAFVVTLSKPNPVPTTFRYGGYGRTATLWKDWSIDYTRSFTLDAGETSIKITVPIIDDDTPENDETLRIYVYATSGIVIRDGFLYATGTITDND